MPIERFNDEEKTIIRNLDLLAQARQELLNKDGAMVRELAQRWEQCLGLFAARLGLREIDPYGENGIEDINGDQDYDDSIQSRFRWPKLRDRYWCGLRANSAFVPKLGLCPYPEEPWKYRSPILALFGRRIGLHIWIDYKPISKELYNRPKAQDFVKAHHLLPGNLGIAGYRWHEQNGTNGASVVRYDSDWIYELQIPEADGFDIDCERLMNIRRLKASTLKEVCPLLASSFECYADLCGRFVNAPDEVRRKLPRYRKSPIVQPVVWESRRQQPAASPEAIFIRQRLNGVLRAESTFVNPCNDKASLRERLRRTLDDLLVRTCAAKRVGLEGVRAKTSLRRSLASHIISGCQLTRDADGHELGWRLNGCRPVLTFWVDVSDECKLVAVVDLRPLHRGARSPDRAFQMWEDSRAGAVLMNPDSKRSVKWIRTKPTTVGNFWGYWIDRTTLQVNMEALANQSVDAVACVLPVIDGFTEACKALRSSSTRR